MNVQRVAVPLLAIGLLAFAGQERLTPEGETPERSAGPMEAAPRHRHSAGRPGEQLGTAATPAAELTTNDPNQQTMTLD